MKYLSLILVIAFHSLLCAQNIDVDGGATYAVVVGVSDYQDPGIPDLRFANRDAEAFANYLRSPAGGGLDNDHLKVLLNEQATAGRIAEALDALIEQAKEGDRVIIYFSGHGDVERKTVSQPGFLLCWDAPSRVYMGGGTYSLAFLQEIVTTLSTQNLAKVTVITDACHAGKLAGNQIGGAQLTSANLAKQYANEVKILSCQPGEFALEGEQWGGGRGCFSYHLVDALYGLADRNADGTITLGEIDRYLEDHVTVEAAPQSQVPMLLGNKTEQLAKVNVQALTDLKKIKASELQIFAATDGRGLEDDILAKADSSVQLMYVAFKKAVAEKRFFLPEDHCADSYYVLLAKNEALAPLHGMMKRNYAAALQDDAQQALNALLKSDPVEMNDYYTRAFKYQEYPALLRRARELLGQGHYLSPSLQAKESFFEAFNLVSNEGAATSDTMSRKSKHFAAQKLLRHAIALQPEAPYLYAQLGFSFANAAPVMTDSVVRYCTQAIELSPTWQLPYLHIALEYWINTPKTDSVDFWLSRALVQDSLNYTTLERIFWLRGQQGRVQEAETLVHQLLTLRPDIPNGATNMGTLMFALRRFKDALEWFQKAAAIKKDSFDLTNEFMGFALFSVGRWREGEAFYRHQIADKHAAFWQKSRFYGWLGMGMLYFKGDYDGAKRAFQQAWDVDTGVKKRAESTAQLAEIACRQGQWLLADSLANAALQNDPNPNEAFVLALSAKAQVAAHFGRLAQADSLFQQAWAYPSYSFLFHEMASFRYGIFLLEQNRQAESEVMFTICDSKAHGQGVLSCVGFALLAAARNEPSKALDWIEVALKRHFADLQFLESAPLLEKIRETKQFQELVKKYFPEK